MSERTVPRGLMVLLLATSVVLLLSVVGLVGYWSGKRTSQSAVAPRSNLPKQEPQSRFSKTPSSQQDGELTGWKVFSHDTISFKYPSSWELMPTQPSGSGFYQEVKDPSGIYSLTFSTEGNYNNQTGKPFKDLYEYINMPYRVKEVTAGGQEAVQPLPRAGSENIYGVFFFSKDAESILNLTLGTPRDGLKIEEGQKLFDQILSTFKFLDQELADETAGWKVYRSEKYGYEFLYPPSWNIIEKSRDYPESYKNDPWILQALDVTKNLKNLEEAVIYLSISDSKDTSRSCSEDIKSYQRNKIDFKEVTIGGVQGIRAVFPRSESAAGDDLCVEYKGRRYNFQLNPGTLAERGQEDLATMNKILSTFKFLE